MFARDAGLGTCVASSSAPGGSSSGSGGSSGGSGSSGSSSGAPCTGAPSCAPGGGLLLCDGGIQPCATGLTCDYGACLAGCSTSQPCAPGSVCDDAAGACVPANACSPDGGGCAGSALCLEGVCVPAPPVGGSVGSCATPGDGGSVTLGGVVTVFPNKDATDVPLADGGTVTFFSLLEDGGVAQVGPTPIVMAGSFPSYSLTVPVGTWTALVQETGVVLPTYFPGLQVRASQLGGSAQLSLNAVVDIDVVGFPAIAGITPQAGHVYWVGLASNCSLTNYVGDYTLGLSPAPPGLGYLSSGLEVDPGLSASSSSVGEFFAEDAPYAPTQYAMAINGGTGTTVLLNGTFVPPQYSPGQDIAVALIYPNFTP